MVTGNSVVCDSVVMGINPGRGDCVIKNPRSMVAWQNVASQVAVHEMAGANESKVIRAETKGKIVSGGMATECETDAGNESRARRQWSPATIITITSPTDP